MKLKTRNKNIITFLTKYWNSRNVYFGDLVHEMKPKNETDWKDYLFTKHFYLLKNDFLKKNGFSRFDNRKWIKYLIRSFYKLYVSEIKAIEFFRSKNIELIKSDKSLDLKYGIDYYYEPNLPERRTFVIVKYGIKNPDRLAKYKQLNFFSWEGFNLANATIVAFSAIDKKEYFFEPATGSFAELNNS